MEMRREGKDPHNRQQCEEWAEEKIRKDTERRQKNLDDMPSVKKSHWAKRGLLSIAEFVFLLQGKEPFSRLISPKQSKFFPYDFCEFHDETVQIIRDALLLKRIKQEDVFDRETIFSLIDLIN